MPGLSQLLNLTFLPLSGCRQVSNLPYLQALGLQDKARGKQSWMLMSREEGGEGGKETQE